MIKNNIVPFPEVGRIKTDCVLKKLSNLARSGQFAPYTVLMLNQAIGTLEMFVESLFDEGA